MMRSFAGGPIRHLGDDYWRRPLFCQRCETASPWLIVSPPLGICHPCFLTMPEGELYWITGEWERKGLVVRFP
ncbi:MAG: hypothetical protein ACYCPQ_00665 [Elusimicrobiota bacterium]